MFSRFFNWILFIVLSIIWGSSFILMKGGLSSLSPYQVASLRIVTAGLVLAPYGIKAFLVIPPSRVFLVFLSGTLGSLVPAYLFCFAELKLDSALAGVLNSLTPIFTLIIAFTFFSKRTPFEKIVGIIIAFCGTVLLYFSQPILAREANMIPVLLIILATVMYGTNVNLVSRYLSEYPSLSVASMALLLNAIPAMVVLAFSGIHQKTFNPDLMISIGCSLILGIVGTAVATILFYRLIKQAGIVFSSMVTYAIPAVAIFWGLLFGEQVGMGEFFSLAVILWGVYLTNRRISGVNS